MRTPPSLLERAGLRVVTAVNGQEALERLAHDGPFDDPAFSRPFRPKESGG